MKGSTIKSKKGLLYLNRVAYKAISMIDRVYDICVKDESLNDKEKIRKIIMIINSYRNIYYAQIEKVKEVQVREKKRENLEELV